MERANSFEWIATDFASSKQPAAESPDGGEDAVDRARAHWLFAHLVDPFNQVRIGTSLERQPFAFQVETEAKQVSSLSEQALGLVGHRGLHDEPLPNQATVIHLAAPPAFTLLLLSIVSESQGKQTPTLEIGSESGDS